MHNNLKVGIYIPTLNKPDFVIRQIKYYASLNSPHPVYIGDDSREENAQILKEAVEKLKDKLEIHYFQDGPEHGQAECELNLVSNIKEKYAIFSGDDDFLVPDSLTKCAEFLENNSDFSLASGLAVSFNLDRAGPYGEIVSMSDYARPEVLAEKAGERLTAYLNRYHVTLFSVAKTTDLKRDWALSLRAAERSFQTEITPGCLAIARGKAKTLDCLGIVRQMHDTRQPSPDAFDWIAKPDWAETYRYFSEILAKEITKRDGLAYEQALQTVKKFTGNYIQKHLAASKMPFGKNKKYGWIKKTAKKIFPRFKEFFYRYATRRLKEKTGPSLHYQVRQPWSSYYQDWRPIEQILKNT